MAKRGQVTIFIILGILIVSIILIFFLYVKPKYLEGKTTEVGFEGCVKEALEKSMKQLQNGGEINPEFTYLYNSEKIPYLCYTPNYYETCTVQKPFLTKSYSENLKTLTKESINTCYEDSISELREQGYSVTSGKLDFNITLDPGVVNVKIVAPTTTGSSTVSKFNVKVSSPIYEMLMIATSIVQLEVAYGETDMDEYRILYPDYKFQNIKRSDGTSIYIIESKLTETKFQFATRSLAWPAGYE